MVKLPDAGALGNSPNLRSGRSAQVDPRLLQYGIRDIRDAGLDSARAYQRGGDAVARAMGNAGDQLARAAGGDQALGRTVQGVGEEAGRAVTRSGERVATAMERAGDYWARATRQAGEDNARAMNALGQSFQGIASNIVEYQLTQDRLDFAQAKSSFAIDKTNLDQEFERDRDYSTMSDRYGARLTELRAKAGENVRNPAMRKRFDLETDLVAANGLNVIKDRAFRVESDVNRADLSQKLDGLQGAAMREQNEGVRSQYLVDGRRYIDAAEQKGYLSASQAQATRTKWAEDYSVAWVESLPAEQRLQMLQRGREETRGARTTLSEGEEKEFQDWARKLPWFGEFKQRYGEEPDLNAKEYDYRAAFKAGVTPERDPHDGNSYHWPSKTPDGRWLKSSDHPTAWKEDFMSRTGQNPDAIGVSNPQQAKAWMQAKGLQEPGTPTDFIPEHKRQQLEKKAVTEITAQRTATSRQIATQMGLAMEEAKVGNAPLFPREAILADPRIMPEHKLPLVKTYDEINKQTQAYDTVLTRLNTGGAFNRYDPNDQKGINLAFQRISKEIGPEAATDLIVRKSYIVPDQVTMTLRSDITSNDPEQVQRGLDAASRMMAFHRQIFANEKGENEIEKAAVAYDYYRGELGWSKDRAAAEVVRQRDPDVKRKLVSDRKELDVVKKVKDETSLSDIAANKRFNNNWFFREDIDPRVQENLLGAYQDLVTKHYRDGKEMGEAKEQAMQDLDKRWGLSAVNGKETITHLPPEKAYAGIPNASDRIAEQAVERVNSARGEAVDRSKIMLVPIPGITWRDFDEKRLPRYELMYWDRNGILQRDSQPFVADPRRMMQQISDKAEAQRQENAATRAAREDAYNRQLLQGSP